MRISLRLLMPILGLVVLLAAGPTRTNSTETLHKANLAALRGDFAQAETLYEQLADTSTDPGLISFNRAYCAVQQQQYRVAEAYYRQVLDDTEAPKSRLASAHYNRAVCLIHIGGLTEYRLAIDHLENCLRSEVSDELRGDAQQNLELAKLLWISARDREKQKPKPNDPARAEPPASQKEEPPPPPPEMEPNKETSKTLQNSKGTKATGPTQTTDQTQGGAGTLPVKFQGTELPPWTEAELTEYLQQLRQRVTKDRRATEAMTAPPRQPNVKDW